MTWNNKVTWSEGLFLSPQLFQQQERYLENFIHARSQFASPFYWGFNHYQLDKQSAAIGKFVLSSASGIFIDGTPFNIPTLSNPPLPLSIQPEHLNQLIYLALPVRSPNGEETTFENAEESLARYDVFEHEIRDSNSIGQGLKTVQMSRLRTKLIPEKELNSAWMGMPVARITRVRNDGAFEVDENFIPPINVYGASSLLTQWLTQLLGNTEQRAKMISERLSGSSTNRATQAAEVTDFLLLQILNRYEPVLKHILSVPETSPEKLYLSLMMMNGDLSTFVRTETRRPTDLPVYQHLNPYSTFFNLVEDLRALLNEALIRTAYNIPLSVRGHGLYVGSIDQTELSNFSHLVLAVSSGFTPEKMASQFPTHCKVGPTDRLLEQVRLHLPGIPLSFLPVAPRQIPFNTGSVYFQIEPKGTLWEHLLKTGGIGIHVATEFPQLKVELWGVR
jgi:type VI secretion system protein ImpJ